MSLTIQQALRRYAAMMNTLNPSLLEPILADNFVYESQRVFQALDSKIAYLDYIRAKCAAIAKAQSPVFAEMGMITAYGAHQPCVILAQGDHDNLVGLVLATISGDKLTRLDLCIVPEPQSTQRTGEYPTAHTMTPPCVPEL